MLVIPPRSLCRNRLGLGRGRRLAPSASSISWFLIAFLVTKNMTKNQAPKIVSGTQNTKTPSQANGPVLKK